MGDFVQCTLSQRNRCPDARHKWELHLFYGRVRIGACRVYFRSSTGTRTSGHLPGRAIMPLMSSQASQDAHATTASMSMSMSTIAGIGDLMSGQTGSLVLRIKELEEQHLAFRNSL